MKQDTQTKTGGRKAPKTTDPTMSVQDVETLVLGVKRELRSEMQQTVKRVLLHELHHIRINDMLAHVSYAPLDPVHALLLGQSKDWIPLASKGSVVSSHATQLDAIREVDRRMRARNRRFGALKHPGWKGTEKLKPMSNDELKEWGAE